jgi:Holliday junction resolvase RusA-like endonuclease
VRAGLEIVGASVSHVFSPPLEFTALGRPAPQGSKKGGATSFYEASRFLKPWRDRVKLEAARAVKAQSWQRVMKPTPVALLLVFFLDRPVSNTDPRPVGPPDLDKLARAVGDSLTQAGVYEDDSQICEYLRLAKEYVGGRCDPLSWEPTSSGVYVQVHRIETETGS